MTVPLDWLAVAHHRKHLSSLSQHLFWVRACHDSEFGVPGVKYSHDKSFLKWLPLCQCLCCFVWHDDRHPFCMLVVLSYRAYHLVPRSFFLLSSLVLSIFLQLIPMMSILYLSISIMTWASLLVWYMVHTFQQPTLIFSFENRSSVLKMLAFNWVWPIQHLSLVQLLGLCCFCCQNLMVSGVGFCNN